MTFQVVIKNKNASDILRWINGVVAAQVFTTRFMLMQHNLGQRMIIFLILLRLKQQLLHRQ